MCLVVVRDLDPRYGEVVGLATEYMSRGSLHDVLHSDLTPQEHRLASLFDKLGVMVDIADGMQFLHCHNVIHRNVSCNIERTVAFTAPLLNYCWMIKLLLRKLKMYTVLP